MTLKNEIFEGIAAYRALNPAKEGRDRYYDYMLRKAEEEDKIMQETGRTREEVRSGLLSPKVSIKRTASTQTPGIDTTTGTPQQAFNPTFGPMQAGGVQGGGFGSTIAEDWGANRRLEHGGMVGRYAGGGLASRGYGSRFAAPGASLGSTLTRTREQDDLVMSLLGADNQERIADESAPNTRARRGNEPPDFAPQEMDTASTPGVSTARQPVQPPGEMDTVSTGALDTSPPQSRLTPQTEIDSATGMQPARQLVDAEIRAKRAPAPRPQRATPRRADESDAPPPRQFEPQEMDSASGGQPAALTAGAPPAFYGAEGAPPGEAAAVDTAPSTAVSTTGRAKYGATTAPEGVQGEPTRTSNIGRAIRGIFENTPLDELYKRRTILIEQRNAPFAQRTEDERNDMDAEIARLDGEIAAMEGQQKAAAGGARPTAGSPAAGGQGSQAPGAPAQPPAASPAAPPAAPALSTKPPSFDPWAGTNPPKGTNQVPPAGSRNTNGPPTSGQNTPGGNPASAAPPRMQRLDDQRRATAFNPDDPNDVAQAQARGTSWQAGQATSSPMQPHSYANEDVAAVLKAGMSGMRPNPQGGPTTPGVGANSRGVYQQFVAAHDQGGRLTPGMATVAGLTAQYQELLRRGRPDLAARIATSILSSASLEAAAAGAHARDLARSGNYSAAAQAAVEGLDYIPDNMNHKLGPDGKSIVVSNQQGQVTGRVPLTGPMVLQIALGLSDGTMMWQALQAASQYGQKPDKTAEGRELTNQLRREQIEGARLRNAKMRAGPQAKSGAAPTSAGQVLQGVTESVFGPERRDAPRVINQGGGENQDYGMPIGEVHDGPEEP